VFYLTRENGGKMTVGRVGYRVTTYGLGIGFKTYIYIIYININTKE